MSKSIAWWMGFQGLVAPPGTPRRYFAGTDSTFPYMRVFDFNSGSPVLLASPASSPGGAGRSLMFAPQEDGRLLAWAGVGSFGLGTLQIFDVNAGTVTRLTTFNNPAGVNDEAVAFSPDGAYILVYSSGTHSGTRFRYFTVSGTTVTFGANWGTFTHAVPFDCIRFTDSGTYVACGNRVYNWDPLTPSLLVNLASLISGTVFQIAWKPGSDDVIAITTNVSPYIYVIKNVTTTPAKLTDPATLPGGPGQGVAWSPDGSKIVVTHSNVPYNKVYSVSDTALTLEGTLDTQPGTSVPPVAVATNVQGLWGMGSQGPSSVTNRWYTPASRAQTFSVTTGSQCDYVSWGGGAI